MSTPKVSFTDLEIGFRNSSHEHRYWLDKRTGRVISIDDEIANVLLGYQAERERWFAFESWRERERIEVWAQRQGMESDFERRE